jgi:hypothetical protein
MGGQTQTLPGAENGVREKKRIRGGRQWWKNLMPLKGRHLPAFFCGVDKRFP